jgi:hypothetical protein
MPPNAWLDPAAWSMLQRSWLFNAAIEGGRYVVAAGVV